MEKLTREGLHSLEYYSENRQKIRGDVMQHKKNRQVPIGDHARLYFEDSTTMQYQIQEMLRAERIFEAAEIQEELDAYNPLIPDGSNLKATLMLEYSDPDIRQNALAQLVGIDGKTWIQAEGFDKVYPISNEDLERETEDKTSSVHFLRFEFDTDMIAALKQGANLSMGIEHDNYNHTVHRVAENVAHSIIGDFS